MKWIILFVLMVVIGVTIFIFRKIKSETEDNTYWTMIERDDQSGFKVGDRVMGNGFVNTFGIKGNGKGTVIGIRKFTEADKVNRGGVWLTIKWDKEAQLPIGADIPGIGIVNELTKISSAPYYIYKKDSNGL